MINSSGTPTYTLDVAGIAKFSGSTLQHQTVHLSQGYTVCGFGGGSVGTQKEMSSKASKDT